MLDARVAIHSSVARRSSVAEVSCDQACCQLTPASQVPLNPYSPLLSRLSLLLSHRRFLSFLYELKDHLDHVLIKQPPSTPGETCRSSIFLGLDGKVDRPERLWYERLHSIVLLDDEAERRELTRTWRSESGQPKDSQPRDIVSTDQSRHTVADDAILQRCEPVLQAQRLRASQCCSNAQVEVHASGDGGSLKHVEWDRVPTGVIDLTVGRRARAMSPMPSVS